MRREIREILEILAEFRSSGDTILITQQSRIPRFLEAPSPQKPHIGNVGICET